VLGTTDEVHAYEEVALVVCVGRGAGRERVVKRLFDRGIREDRFSAVVDPNVRVPPPAASESDPSSSAVSS
jgi:hypothetical protein